MPYSDPQLEARLKTKIAGTANKQQPIISQPTRSGGFSDPQLEARLKGISSGGQRASLPPLTPIQPIKTEQPKQGLLKSAVDFAGKFTGISTGEVGSFLSKANEFGVVHKNISPTDVINLGKRALDGIKGIIGAESEKYAKKEQQYKIDQNIPDYQALDFNQTIDLNSVGMLKLAKGDIQVDYDELNAKENKTKLDQYRLNNMKATLDEINKNLELSPGKRKKNEVFITGLALGRVSSNLASGFLGSLKGVADFVRWRGEVAESESVSKFGETTAKHLNQWAEAVAPDNPELADEILQGAGSTLAFYLPGAGVSSLTTKLATVSPKLATLFGVTASATLEAATESGNTYVEMVDSGASREDADLAASQVFAGNIIYNIISDKVGLFSDAKGVKKILTTSLAEGSQEAFQDGLQATAQKKDIDGKAMAKTFFISAVVGGGMGSVTQNASISDDINKDDKEKLAELADKIRQVEAGADPEMLGFNFVDTTSGFEVASSGIQLTDKGVYAELNNQQLEYLKDEVAKLGFTATDKPHLTPIDKLRNSEMKLVTLDEIKDLSPNVAKAFEGLQTTQKKTDQFDYGSTQLDLTGQVAEDVTEFAKSLPESEVYKDPNANYDAQRTGRESEPHITVLYGLDTTNQAEVEGLVQSVKPIEVELGEVSQFDTNEDYDVVKVDVISDELAALYAKLDKVLETPGKTFDEYQPHVTIAYVKKGIGAKYVGDTRFKGQKITLNNLIFSSKDGKRVNIPLLGKQAENKVSDKVNQAKILAEKQGEVGIVRPGNNYAELNGVDPNTEVVVYRGVKSSQNKKLSGGEWVTQRKELARLYSRDRARASGEDAKIISQKVKAKNLIISKDTAPGVTDEFIYTPKDESVNKNDLLFEEAKKYKSVEDFIASQGNFRDGHVAPSFDDTPVKQRIEDGGDFNLAEVVKGYHTQPKDYFDEGTGARMYGYGDQSGMESLTAINNVKRGAKTITAYRSIPKEIDVRELIDGDWISFSKEYVINHGESRFGEGEYKVVEQEVKPNQVWWDGNDIREWGYDTGKAKNLSRYELINIWNEANGWIKPRKKSLEVTKDTKVKSKIIKAKTQLKQYPSVYAGLSSKGSEKIHNFELRKPPKPGTEEFKLHKKVTELIRKYAQTIGEGYTPRNALGVYFPKTKNIRVNSINNVTVAAHEIAHFLDYANGITDQILASKDPNIQEQIKKIYLQYYPTARENHQKRLQTLEGFAVLLQKYTEQPTTISNEYPDLVKEFLQKDGKYYHPVIGEILTDLNQMVGEYQGLEALDKIGARVTSENTNINKPSFLNFWQKLRTQVADEVYPVEVLAQKGKVGFTKEDPSLWVRAYNAVSGIINNNISTDRGYWSFTDLQNGWQKKYDYNWKSLIESTQRRNVLDSFSHYLVARREWYLYQELDQLKAARDQVEMIAKAFGTVKADEMAEFDRDLRASLSEDYGVDLTEMEYEKAKAAIKKLFEQTDKAYQEQKEILDNDAFSREEVEAAYTENKERFKDEETMFDALTREDLNLMHNPEVQLLDDKSYNQLKSREGYASFKRQFYDEIVGDLDAPGAIRVGKTKVSSLIGRTGSERTIINPLFSALVNHSEIVRKSMKQVVYNQVGKLGTSALMPNLMQVVPIQTTVDKNSGAISFPQEKDNNIIMARQGYKRVPVLMDAEIKTIIDTVLSHKNIDTFTQLYTGLSRMFTAGTTGLYPQFALTNFVIDQITATANSYNKYKGLYSPMKDMLTVLRKKNSVEAKYYEEYLVMGGERQTFTGWQRLEPKDLFKRISDEKTKMQKAIDSLQKGIDILSIPSAKSEIFSRATEYINARKSGKSQIVSLEEAGRVTAPFHHIGAWGAKEGQRSFFQTFIRGLPFFNASIQVLDQTARVANTKEGRKRMTFVTLAVTAAYLASIMAMMGGDDEQKEQYKDLEAEDLANFIYFPNPSGEGLLRLKMANTFSVPGTVINMIIANKMFSAKYEARDAMEAATAFLPDQFNVTDPTKAILGWMPQLFKPITHVIFNVKEYPTVTSLVSQGLQRKPAALQYNEGTSVFAKKLGELLDLSPIKIDYLLTGYLGRASGFLTGKPGVYNLASSVMRDYYFTSGRRVREFYDMKEKTDGEYTAYQNLEKGFEDLPKDRVDEIYRVNIITTNIDELLGEYRDLDVEVDQEKAAELRAKILVHIEMLENGTKPKNFGKWSLDAKKRRQKNKLDKK